MTNQTCHAHIPHPLNRKRIRLSTRNPRHASRVFNLTDFTVRASCTGVPDRRTLWIGRTPLQNATARVEELSLWAMDTWQVLPRLTVSAGLRWLYGHVPWYSEFNRFSIFWKMGDGTLHNERVEPD